jgi:hypothetical protein
MISPHLNKKLILIVIQKIYKLLVVKPIHTKPKVDDEDRFSSSAVNDKGKTLKSPLSATLDGSSWANRQDDV